MQSLPAHLTPLSIKSHRFEICIALLFCITLGALFTPKQWLEQTLVIHPDTHLDIYVTSDVASGGSSTAAITQHRGYTWFCELVRDFAHPYCSLEIMLAESHQQGIDLSGFDRVKLWLDYTGPSEMLRFNLRNYSDAYAIENIYHRLKYNVLEFPSSMIKDGQVQFELRDVDVADWWVAHNKVPPHLSRVELNNVALLELSASNTAAPGRHDFTLSRIEFSGSIIALESLYEWTLSGWLVLISAYVIYHALVVSRRMRSQLVRERELMDINMVLDSRSRQLDIKVRTDALTGLLNRTGLENALQTLLGEQRASGTPLSLILFDVDHFKLINDNFGHAQGDAVLVELANVVRQQVRRQDVFARWGGEEFVLVCHDTTAAAAARLAHKIRDLIAAAPFAHGQPVTASFGVASLPPGGSLEVLFNQADAALYRAKNAGRNRVECSE